jgi:ADP-heptose:LPS heptosyltransferase
MAGPTLGHAKHILVCLRYGIGDVVMQFPMLHALRSAAPEARITAVGAEPAIELLEGAGLVDEIVAYGRWSIRHFWDSGTEETRSQIADWLGQAKFDLVLDAAYAPEPISHAATRIGPAELSTDEAVLLDALAGGANGAEALACGARSGWGLSIHAPAHPAIALSESEIEFARMFLDGSGVWRPLVAFCPVASSNLKRWPKSRFAEVADWAIENGRGVVLFGGDVDETVAGMRQLMSPNRPRDVVVRGLHLRQVAAVLAECAALVSNDTGLMHIAAAVGIPVVAVFGPTNPHIYLPRGQAVGLAGGLDCPHRAHSMSPPGCWASEHCLIGSDNCTVAVHTENVIAALRQVLPAGTASLFRARSVTSSRALTGSARPTHGT